MNISFNNNSYFKFKSKLVKFDNFDILSPNFAAPSISNPLQLKNFKIKYSFFIIHY
jgi:hypothetical protein